MTIEELTLLSSAAVTHQVAATVTALQAAYDAVPLDDDIDSPRARDENAVRRMSLLQAIPRLRIPFEELQQLEPQVVATQSWIAVLQRMHREFSARLLATPAPGRLRDQLQMSLRDLQRGPERAPGGEVSAPILHEVFAAQGVVPLRPGIYFEGKGGLLQAEARLTVLQAEMVSARVAVDAALSAAETLLAPKS